MKVLVTYKTTVTKEMEVDNKYLPLRNDKTYDIHLAGEMAQEVQFDLNGDLLCIEDENENLLIEW